MKNLIRTVLTACALATVALGASAAETKVIIFGGGSSHDYDRWFNKADTVILQEAGAVVEYTEDLAGKADAVKGADVLFLTNNKPYGDEATKEAVVNHIKGGKGAVVVHAGLWYNWPDWPEYNQWLAGGGSRGHDRLGEFEVKVTGSHEILKGVPETFKITDELYWFEPDPKGTSIEVLATAWSPRKQKEYPMIFIIQHPTARVVGITLGHDGKAHDHPAFKRLIQNALRWAAK